MFKWEQEKQISITTAHGVDLKFWIDDDFCSEIEINGVPMDNNHEVTCGLFVGIGGETVSMRDLALAAQNAYPQLKKEINQDAANYEAHIRAESSMSRFV